ncbi:MAG: TonB-dependent receptor [Rhodocyclaceae bacterium]|nr:TonB-dependent receptor [Rhodocyclaceae bacterium]
MRAGPLYANVDADRQMRRSHLELQHIFRLNPAARVVWGFEQRHESVASKLMFDTTDRLSIRLRRLFGNLEWRLAPMLLLNAGAMLEKHSFAGTDLAPRLMLNFQPLPGQTLRLGATTAYRTPSLAEERADVKYYVANAPVVVPKYLARGGLQPERIRSSELSYLGEFPSIGLTADVRLFHENVSHIIDKTGNPANFLNRWGALLRGHESQLRWKPTPDTLVLLNHSRVRIESDDQRNVDSAPRRSTMLFLSQKLPPRPAAEPGPLLDQRISMAGLERLPAQAPPPRCATGPSVPKRASEEANSPLSHRTRRIPTASFRADYVFKRRTFATLSLEF